MSYCPIVYNQTYKSKADSSSAGLNVRHLQYIATRPGAIYNPSCGFGLWGHLPGDDAIRIQNDLEYAKRIAREASQDHTLYRGFLSVGKKDAEKFGFYQRERWEQLVNDHIQVIAKENDIKPENFFWCASMHYKKGHPHTHIIFWDNGDNPRPEYIPDKIFDKKMERIRAEFSGDIHREEIREVQTEQQSQVKELRTAVRAMCREANPERALDLDRLYSGAKLKGLSVCMYELIRDMPSKGSLRYAYLPPEYKEKVNRLIRECLEVPELAKELGRYETFTRQISELYSNSKESTEKTMEKALKKLYGELGNQVMAAIREIRDEIRLSHPISPEETDELIRLAVTEVVPSLESYQTLLEPPSSESASAGDSAQRRPSYYAQMNQVVKDVLLDARIRLRLQHYALTQAGIDLDTKPDVPRKKTGQTHDVPVDIAQAQAERSAQGTQDPEAPGQHALFGKVLSTEEWDSYQNIYRDAKLALRREIAARLVMDTLQVIHTEGHISDFTVQKLIQTAVTEVVPNLESYQQLKELLPAERIPVKCMERQISGYHDQLNNVVADVLTDARIRLRLQSYALAEALPEDRTEPQQAEHSVCGQKLTDEEWTAYQEVYREVKLELRREITAQLRQEAGWSDEAVRTGTASMLCGMMRLLSRSASQRQAGAAQARQSRMLRSKDKSREARKDQRATQSNSGEWEADY